MTYDPQARRDTPLALKLKARIRRDGPISVRDYMAACLYDDADGYYRTKTAIGRGGDFVTAPEISQIFGELIGLWCAVVWQQMGSPGHFNLIELGPGRGTLLQDALRATRRVPGFAAAVKVVLVETNAVLIDSQRQTLRDVTQSIRWSTVENLVSENLAVSGPLIVVANEVLDCEPREQLEMTAQGWQRRMVALDEAGRLIFQTPRADAAGETPVPLSASVSTLPSAQLGQIFEPTPCHWSKGILACTGMAAALMLDYGHTATGLGDTLQAVRAQRFEHPLTSPGEADLTMQVDFQAQAAHFAAPPQPLRVDGPVAQAEFLGRLGIAERASRLMAANPAKAGEIEMAVGRLMAPNGMGTRFKAIGLRTSNLPELPGFESARPASGGQSQQRR